MSATKELLERRGADYIAALVDHADEMIERLERTNAELLAALEAVVVSQTGNGIVNYATWKMVHAAIARAKGEAK